MCQTVVNPWITSVNKAKILAPVELSFRGNLFICFLPLPGFLYCLKFLVIPSGKIPRGGITESKDTDFLRAL